MLKNLTKEERAAKRARIIRDLGLQNEDVRFPPTPGIKKAAKRVLSDPGHPKQRRPGKGPPRRA